MRVGFSKKPDVGKPGGNEDGGKVLGEGAGGNPFAYGQCTYHGYEKRPDIFDRARAAGVPNNRWNAHHWANNARAAGMSVGSTPEVGAIAVYPTGYGGSSVGHVAYVTEVRGGGGYVVSERNWNGNPEVSTRLAHPYGGTEFIYGGGTPLAATLDGQSPTPGLTMTAGGASVELAFNVRMNQPFSTAFVLRPEQPTEATISQLVSVKGDFPGAVASSDAAVGYYRARIQIPEGTPPGSYYMQWVLIDGRSGRVTDFRPSMRINVVSGSLNWFLRNSNAGGAPDIGPFAYGEPGYQKVVGDWDGNGTDTAGVFRAGIGHWFLRNGNSGGAPDVDFSWASPGDTAVAGDWNGDGVDTVGVFRPSNGTWYLKAANDSSGALAHQLGFASPGDQPVVGDWDGNGTDTIGVFRANNGTWYLKASNAAGGADHVFGYASPGDLAVTGDWDGNGSDGIGVFRPSAGAWFLKNNLGSGAQDFLFGFGSPGDTPIAGDYDGDGDDTIGVVRNSG